ncbi:MAG: LPS assembly lipoprotein LptE [candidate division NC10 bacterium]|nr:LPS assembly lipoprotein LptE [candidate division NC10 bacterium]
MVDRAYKPPSLLASRLSSLPAAILVIGLVGAGCGYHGQANLPNDLQRIHLTVTNKGASRPGLEAATTQALTQRILSAGGRVVAEETQADAMMQAAIVALENNPVAFDRQDIAQRFRLAVVLNVQVIQRKDKVELANEQVRGEAYYSTPPGITGTEVAQNDAIRRALRDLADKVVTRVVDPF